MYNVYELLPDDSHKSFYGKAKVIVTDEGEYLRSYNTIVMYRDNNGNYYSTWNGWSATTGRHIKAFSGLNKAGYFNLPFKRL